MNNTVIFVIFCTILNVFGGSIKRTSDIFELSVVHFNDFHARFDETNDEAGTCKDEKTCIGGYSRLYKQINNILDDKPKTVLLNAGDNYQGTLWYTVGKWNVTQEFMNKLPIDAEVLGNHEFDDGIAGIVPYIKALKHPIVVSNIDDRLEPSIQGTYQKSTIIERDGKRIGIIGVITSECAQLASTEQLVFLDESSSVNAEAERLVKEEDVFTIIVLSHSGYDVDQQIAKNASEKISLIVGGHSHSFLWTGDNPPGPGKIEGPYPTIVDSVHGHKVLVTQAAAYTLYLGNVTIYLDTNGEIVDYSGAPIFLDHSLPQDPQINEELEPWRDRINAQGDVILGSSLVKLSASNCYTKECSLGNFVTDAMVFEYTKSPPDGMWTEVPIAIANAGSLRTTIDRGNISYSDLLTAQPFGNTVDHVQIQGKYLKETFEQAVKTYTYGSVMSSLNLLQVSGAQLVYDLTKPEGERVASLKVRCQSCTVPIYEEIDMDKFYNIAACSFLLGGGDGFDKLANNIINRKIGRVDVDIYTEYIEHRSPLFEEEGGRIVIKTEQNLVYIRR